MTTAVLLDLTAEVYEVRDLGSITLVQGCLRAFGSEAEALEAARLRE